MEAAAIHFRTVVVGGGSVGLLYAARLVRSGLSVSIVTRSPRQAEQLGESGLLFKQLDGQKVLVPVEASPVGDGLPEADLYVLTVKQNDLPGLLPALRDTPDHARVLALQNGMGHHELLTQVLPEERCFYGIHTEGARRIHECEVEHTGKGALRVGPWQERQEQDSIMHAFVRAANAAGIDTTYERSIEPFAWRKLLANSLINPLTAIFEIPNGALLENSHTNVLMRELFVEASAVAASCGQKIGESDWQEIGSICRNTSRNLSSMLQDVKLHRQTEVQAINGFLVQKGKEAGIPTPLHETLLRIVLLKTCLGTEKEGGDST